MRVRCGAVGVQDKSAFLRWSAHLPSGATPVPRPSSGGARPPPATTTTNTTTTNNNPPLPHLYLSIFALASIYVPPSSPLRDHLPLEAPRVYADAAREFLLRQVGLIGHRHQKTERTQEEEVTEEAKGGRGGGGLEAVQSAVLLAMCDWGQGQVDRAWFMSCESPFSPLS